MECLGASDRLLVALPLASNAGAPPPIPDALDLSDNDPAEVVVVAPAWPPLVVGKPVARTDADEEAPEGAVVNDDGPASNPAPALVVESDSRPYPGVFEMDAVLPLAVEAALSGETMYVDWCWSALDALLRGMCTLRVVDVLGDAPRPGVLGGERCRSSLRALADVDEVLPALARELDVCRAGSNRSMQSVKEMRASLTVCVR